MNATAAQLFAALDQRNPGTTATAAELGVSKQAYSLARQRGSLSDILCIRAAALLGLDPAHTLIALHRDDASTPEAAAVWENVLKRITEAPESRDDRAERSNEQDSNNAESKAGGYLYYVKSESQPVIPGDSISHVRSLQTRRIEEAATLAKWMLCVAKISPTSPRFVYYAINWHVIDKINYTREQGRLENYIKDAPAFSAAELRAALDFLDKHHASKAPNKATDRPTLRQAVTS